MHKILSHWHKIRLEFIIFMCGAIVMIFEIVGSRILGPYLGTSIFVWTSLIGIILASLSIGYHFGGKIADRNPSTTILSATLLYAAIAIACTLFIKDVLLATLPLYLSDTRISAVIAACILFSPGSILLGIVSPYAAKLRLQNLHASGTIIGNLYALSTTGSIAGTFAAGFYLIPRFGTNNILLFLIGLLLLLSLIISPRSKIRVYGWCFVFFITIGYVHLRFTHLYFTNIHHTTERDTMYGHVWITDTHHRDSGRPVRLMQINNENSSAFYRDGVDLVYDYTKYYDLVQHFHPKFHSVLMLGGAGYTYPRYFLAQYPDATIDVVEIDPILTQIAREFFNLADHPRLQIIHDDARTYLNTNQKKYDAIFVDVFSTQYTLPYTITTREALTRMHDVLTDDGIVITNTITAIGGKNGKFLQAQVATYKAIFPHVYIFPVQDAHDPLSTQNIMIVASRTPVTPYANPQTDPDITPLLAHYWQHDIPHDLPILTDDHAPVEYYSMTR